LVTWAFVPRFAQMVLRYEHIDPHANWPYESTLSPVNDFPVVHEKVQSQTEEMTLTTESELRAGETALFMLTPSPTSEDQDTESTTLENGGGAYKETSNCTAVVVDQEAKNSLSSSPLSPSISSDGDKVVFTSTKPLHLSCPPPEAVALLKNRRKNLTFPGLGIPIMDDSSDGDSDTDDSLTREREDGRREFEQGGVSQSEFGKHIL